MRGVRIGCSHCGVWGEVDPAWAGRRAKCNKCGTTIVTPCGKEQVPASMTSARADAVLKEHFRLAEAAREAYRHRADPRMLAQATALCEAQVSLAPQASMAWYRWTLDSALHRNRFSTEVGDQPEWPEVGDQLPHHYGYEQLGIIWEKQGYYEEVIALCEQGQKEGWHNDFRKRIERCRRKCAQA